MSVGSVDAIRSIFHPTDLSEASEVAFDHALGIALRNRSYFDILHVDSADTDADEADWEGFPQVRRTLERWGLLDDGSAREAVAAKLGVKVRKVNVHSKKLVDAVVSYLEDDPAELVVLATEGRTGVPRWLKPSISEPLARRSAIATLFVPADARRFVSSDHGDVRLRRVLVPVNHEPDPQLAIDAAEAFLRSLGATGFVVDVLFVGPSDRMPRVRTPTSLECSFEQFAVSGVPAHEILHMANERSADLIVMATEGHKGFLDALRGSTTERVLRRSPCPVLTVPVRAT